ncbi:MAG: hypothetical protein GX542_05835 [Rhodococcus sp.]|nr:hypothetical protein [Rhodococcus sp. (in: high G+C Gram-positive bacteria)]
MTNPSSAGIPSGSENFQSARWDHAAIASALHGLNPTEAERVATVWRTLGERYENAMTTFAAAIDSAGTSGWSGSAGDAVRSSVTHHVHESLDAGSGLGAMANTVSDVASSLDTARNSVEEPQPVPDDWRSVLPWNWTRGEDAAAAEQSARATMELLFGPAIDEAAHTSVSFPVPESAYLNGADPVGTGSPEVLTEQDLIGPDGPRSIPSASPTPDQVTAPDSGRSTPALPDRASDSAAYGTALATGALAGALGGGVAQYAGRVVAEHHAQAAERAEQEAAEALVFIESDDDEDFEESDSVLETLDTDSPLVGDMPRVAPAVIGE